MASAFRKLLCLGAMLLIAPAPVLAHAVARQPAVLLVHGWAGDSRVWGPVLKRLGSTRAVAVDLPGHGRGAPPLARTSFHEQAAAIERDRGALASNCVVLAVHSNGAYAARQYYREHREKVAAIVVVEGTFNRPYKDPAAFGRQIDAIGAAWDRFQKAPFGLDNAAPATRRTVLEVASDASAATAVASARALLDPDFWSEDRIAAPVTFVWAESPQWDEAHRQALRMLAPRAEFVSAGKISHYAQLDAPDLVTHEIKKAVANARCR